MQLSFGSTVAMNLHVQHKNRDLQFVQNVASKNYKKKQTKLSRPDIEIGRAIATSEALKEG